MAETIKKLKSKSGYMLLGLILLLAACSRLYRIASIPMSVNWDEAAIGWNAKSIFYTRRDEFGTRLPLSFRSFGDYKAPLYIYLTAPLIGLFGLNVYTVRFLSIFAGIASVGIIYLIVKQLFNSEKTAIIASLFMAITPWSFVLSRGAYEQNLALLFILIGAWLFLKAISNPKYLVLSFLSFALSLYTYHSPKIFVPAFLLGFLVIYRKPIFKPQSRKWLFVSGLIGLILLLPLLNSIFFSDAALRFQGTSIFYIKEGESRPFNLSLASDLISNHLSHYSPKFLFQGGSDNFRIQTKQFGPLLLIEAPFLLAGLWYLLKNKQRKSCQFILLWLLTGPIAAAVGREAPHHIRAFNLFPALALTTALGAQRLLKSFKSPWLITVSLLFFLNLGYFTNHYFTQYPIYSAQDWQYGYQQVAEISTQLEPEADKIIISSHYGQPHIFNLFYQDRSPQQVFFGGMIKYLYRRPNWLQDREYQNVYIIAAPEEFPAEAEGFIDDIYFPDGNIAFRVLKTSGERKIQDFPL